MTKNEIQKSNDLTIAAVIAEEATAVAAVDAARADYLTALSRGDRTGMASAQGAERIAERKVASARRKMDSLAGDLF